MKKGKWQRTQRKAAESLLGAHVTRWVRLEMAIRDAGPNGLPQFEVEGVDCVQLWHLEAETDQGFIAITTHQADDLWGLQLEKVAERSEADPGGIFRRRELPELPHGEIEAVAIRTAVPSSDLAEVVIEVSGARVTLVAGEIEERIGGSLSSRWLDESVLVFTDAEVLESIDWTPPRKRFVERRRPPLRLAPLPELLVMTLESTPVGRDVTDADVVRTFGRHIERLWRTHLDDVDGWPTGHTTDDNSVHVCYRAAGDLVEAFGVSWYDFGPDVFAYRARFRAPADDAAAVDLSVEPSPRSGGPRLHADNPVVLARAESGAPRRIASLAAAGIKGNLTWVDAISVVERDEGFRAIAEEPR